LSAPHANDPDKGNTYVWPKDQGAPTDVAGLKYSSDIEEVIMWSSIDPEDSRSYEERPTVATIPTRLAEAEIMEREDHDIKISDIEMKRSLAIRTVQPLVSVTCHIAQASNLKDFGDWIDYPARNGSIIRLSTFAEVEQQTHWNNVTVGIYDNPVWKVAPDDPESLVGIFLYKIFPIKEHHAVFHLETCLISSYWWMSEASLAYVSDPPRRRLTPGIPHLTSSGVPMMKRNLRPIIVNPANITSLNSINYKMSSTSHLAPALAMICADALSALPYIQMGKWHGIPRQERPSSWSHYTITQMYTGFGYGSTDTPSKLAAAVIVAYCVISLVFVTYIIVTGHTSIAWNSAMELIVLALQSKEPDSLGHVSVGLDSMETFRRTVGIRVNTVPVRNTGETRERLELIFEHDKDAEKRGLTKVVRNRAY
jgi:hypothetical protein